jgi:hypothetical protein
MTPITGTRPQVEAVAAIRDAWFLLKFVFIFFTNNNIVYF